MSVMATMVATLFADPNLSTPARYEARDGTITSLRVVLQDRSDMDASLGQVGAVVPGFRLDVRCADLEAHPKEGDIIVVGDAVYQVRGKPRRDAERLTWHLICTEKNL